MYNEDRRNIWIVGIVVALILLISGGCYLADQNRKAQEAEAKVKILAAACETADADYRGNWQLANTQWNQTREDFLATRQFQLGVLTAPESRSGDIAAVCALEDLWAALESGKNKVAVYDTAVSLNSQLGQIVSTATVELQSAGGAKVSLEGAEQYAWGTVKPRVDYPPSDAVDPDQARRDYGFGWTEINTGWLYMAVSRWGEADFQADLAWATLTAAYDFASSPTPTPQPTNTPQPTAIPVATWDWGDSDTDSDTSTGSDSGSWDSDDSDSGSWDTGGSDSGSWDSGGDDGGSWGDDGGGDGGSWDPIIRRTRVR